LVISGDGILNIVNVLNGINAEMVYLNGITSFIMAKEKGINVYSNDGCLIKDSKVSFEKGEVGIYSPYTLTIMDSFVNIIDTNVGIAGNKFKIDLRRTKMYIETKENCIKNLNLITITDLQMVLKSNTVALLEQNLFDLENDCFYVSNDDSNYFYDEIYWKYKYLKLASKNEINDLIINDEGLIFEIDKSFLVKDENNKNETEGEYTENEYIEITNPDTVDNIFFFVISAILPLITICIIIIFRRFYGRDKVENIE